MIEDRSPGRESIKVVCYFLADKMACDRVALQISQVSAQAFARKICRRYRSAITASRSAFWGSALHPRLFVCRRGDRDSSSYVTSEHHFHIVSVWRPRL